MSIDTTNDRKKAQNHAKESRISLTQLFIFFVAEKSFRYLPLSGTMNASNRREIFCKQNES